MVIIKINLVEKEFSKVQVRGLAVATKNKIASKGWSMRHEKFYAKTFLEGGTFTEETSHVWLKNSANVHISYVNENEGRNSIPLQYLGKKRKRGWKTTKVKQSLRAYKSYTTQNIIKMP